jgi:hypothetical protein
MKAVLVYQAGIANVFTVDLFTAHAENSRNAKRLLQHTFAACEWFARGLVAAGAEVRTAACNRAGDIVDATWSNNLDEQPFSDSFHSVGKPLY